MNWNLVFTVWEILFVGVGLTILVTGKLRRFTKKHALLEGRSARLSALAFLIPPVLEVLVQVVFASLQGKTLAFVPVQTAGLYIFRLLMLVIGLAAAASVLWPRRGFQYAVLILATLFALYPVWFAILASVREGERLYTLSLPGMFVPLEPSLKNYQVMLFERPFLTWMKNSLSVAAAATVFSLIISTSAAFALSRFRFRGREAFLILLLALSTFPGVLSLVAVAQLLTALGLFGKHVGLVLAYTTGTLVFCTWNLKGYFDTIPIDLEEAAMLDGCGPVQAFFLIALPLARPALAVTAILAFMGSWGDFIFASVLVPAPDKLKLAVPALYSLANSMSVPWGYFAAGAVIVVIPTLLVYLALQRYFESGLTLGGVKG